MTDFATPAPTAPALTLAGFLGRFAEVDQEATGYAVPCPAHADDHPSLRVAYNAEEKKLALRCRAGCATTDVVAALGLEMSALFDVEPGDLSDVRSVSADPEPASISDRAALAHYLHRAAAASGEAPDAREYAARRFGIDEERFVELGLGFDPGTIPGGHLVLSRALFHDAPRLVVPFRDFDGRPHYLQARALVDSGVRARWSGPANPADATWGKYGVFDGGTGWAEAVITEGPGDALAAVGSGYDSVAIRGAALASSPGLTDLLASRLEGRRIVLAGDNDRAGRAFNDTLGERLTAAGMTVFVLAIPAGTKDLSDWRSQNPDDWAGTLTAAVRSAERWAPTAKATPTPAPAAEPEDDLPHTELANAIRLFRRMRGELRFTPALGFLVWNGAAWEIDKRSAVRQAAQQSALDLMAEALALPKGEPDSAAAKRRGAALRWAHDSQRSRGIEAVMTEVRGLPGVAVDASDLDSHPDLLACANGTVDLRTGVLRPADPADLLTKALTVAYDPAAHAPRWERFLTEVFPTSPGTATYLERLVGYGITGHATEQCFVLLHGHGSNGKSVFTSAIYDVFAPITANVGIETFLTSGAGADNAGGPTADLASLRGARLVLTSESEHGARLAEAKLKRLTGGDPVTARHLYKEPFTFFPTFLLMLSTNGLPEIRGQDDGIWRRIKIVEWAQKFEGARKDKTLSAQLHQERAGILAWAVRGAAAWYRDGVGEPPAVGAAVAEYRGESDKLAEFYPGRIVDDPAGWLTRAELYAAYREWADEQGTEPSQQWRNTTLFSAIRALGVKPGARRGTRGFLGVRLARPTDAVDDEPNGDPTKPF